MGLTIQITGTAGFTVVQLISASGSVARCRDGSSTRGSKLRLSPFEQHPVWQTRNAARRACTSRPRRAVRYSPAEVAVSFYAEDRVYRRPAVNQTRSLFGDSERRTPNGPQQSPGANRQTLWATAERARLRAVLAISRKFQGGREITGRNGSSWVGVWLPRNGGWERTLKRAVFDVPRGIGGIGICVK